MIVSGGLIGIGQVWRETFELAIGVERFRVLLISDASPPAVPRRSLKHRPDVVRRFRCQREFDASV